MTDPPADSVGPVATTHGEPSDLEMNEAAEAELARRDEAAAVAVADVSASEPPAPAGGTELKVSSRSKS